jgi:hypothetical protein
MVLVSNCPSAAVMELSLVVSLHSGEAMSVTNESTTARAPGFERPPATRSLTGVPWCGVLTVKTEAMRSGRWCAKMRASRPPYEWATRFSFAAPVCL